MIENENIDTIFRKLNKILIVNLECF